MNNKKYQNNSGNNGQNNNQKPEKHTHKYVETITKQATCTENGVKTYTCTVCKETKTEIIPALKHKWSAWKTKSAATVLKAKVQERTCTTCKKTQTRTKGEKLCSWNASSIR